MSTTTIFRTLLSLCVLGMLTIGQARVLFAEQKTAPSASGSDEASERFRSGVAFYKDKDFEAALVEFKRAYELAPNYKVLFNLGQTSRELDDYARALSAFEQYLSEGGNEVPAARRKDVRGWIDELKKKVGSITVETSVNGAEVLVDDVPVGVTPLATPVVVNVGRRKLTATLKGYSPAQRVVDVAGMEESTVALELTEIDKPVPLATPLKPAPPPAEAETPVAAWVVFSATAASVVVTGVMGGLALSARSDLDAALEAFPGNTVTIEEAQSRTNTFALATDIVGAVAIAGAITTVILFAVAPGAPDDDPVTTSVQLSPLGIGVRGAF